VKRPLFFGWSLFGILLGLYFIVKILAWGYGFQVARLDRKLQHLRPALSAIILADQMKLSKEIYAKAFDQICQMDIEGNRLLQEISRQIPPLVTLEKLDLDPQMGLRIQGAVQPGGSSFEEVLLPWAKELQAHGETVQIRQLDPSPRNPALWRFELKMTEFHCA